MIIDGRHIQGMKGARRSVKRQKNHFIELGLPGADRFFDGTINIDTSPFEYMIESFDYIFRDVGHKSFPRKRIEDFGFIIIAELIHRGKRYRNWGYFYVPHSSPHYERQHIFELIGPELPALKVHDTLNLTLNENRLQKIIQ
jgi:hypothetical protein